jgi:hypothetical protein
MTKITPGLDHHQIRKFKFEKSTSSINVANNSVLQAINILNRNNTILGELLKLSTIEVQK